MIKFAGEEPEPVEPNPLAMESGDIFLTPNVPVQQLITFDLVGAKEKMFFYLEQTLKMFEQAEALVVNSEATNVDATALGTTAMAVYNKIREIKKTIPLYVDAKEFVSKVDDLEKMLTEKLYSTSREKRTVVSIMKSKLSQYTAVLESERRKQEEAARKAQEDLQKKLNKEAKKTGTVAPVVPDVVIPKKETTVRTESGSSHAVHKWTHEITDLLKIPIKYLQRACQSKTGAAALKSVIQDDIAQGIRDPGIPGVHIFEEIGTTFRT